MYDCVNDSSQTNCGKKMKNDKKNKAQNNENLTPEKIMEGVKDKINNMKDKIKNNFGDRPGN